MKKDKILHIIIGILIALIVCFLLKSPLIAFIISAVAGALKEYWDSKGNGTVELADFLATVAGGVMGVAIWNIISHSI